MSFQIRTKRQFYALQNAGLLGNHIPLFFSVEEWRNDPLASSHDLWGIRSAVAGGDKRMRLNVPTAEVESLCREWYPSGGVNISPMIDRYAVLRGEVFENTYGNPFGINLFYVPPGKLDAADPWRGSFRKYGKQASGLTAIGLLKYYLWPSDYEDLRVLLDQYPNHVVEFSACSKPVGVIPGRNTIWWEVRRY